MLDNNVAGGGNWSNICNVSSVVSSNPVNGLNNLNVRTMPLSGFGFSTSGITLVPSAVSLQIINPEPLQTSTGTVYSGVMQTSAKIAGRTETWDEYAVRFVEFQAPRLLAAGKLALKGVHINSYPLSMSQIAEFTSLDTSSTSGTGSYNVGIAQTTGWAPIMVYNPSGIALDYLLTVEYRVRFDLANPASSAHRHFPVATDSQWDSLMKKAAAMGNGVRDIADVVAQAGAAIEGVSQFAKVLSV